MTIKQITILLVCTVAIGTTGYIVGGGWYLEEHQYPHPFLSWFAQQLQTAVYESGPDRRPERTLQDWLSKKTNSVEGYRAARFAHEVKTHTATNQWDYQHWRTILRWLSDQASAQRHAFVFAAAASIAGILALLGLFRLLTWEKETRPRRRLARITARQAGRHPIRITGVPLPAGLHREPHILIAGRTGQGKSTALADFVCQWRAQGKSAVIVDYKSELIRKFWKRGDKILNPFLRYSRPYSLLADAQDDLQLTAVAEALAPTKGHPVSDHFQVGARTIISEALREARSNLELWEMLHSREVIAEKLWNTPARTFLESGGKEAASFMSTLMNSLSMIQHFPAVAGREAFSIRRFVRTSLDRPGPFLWIPISERQRSALSPFVTVVGGIVIDEKLDMPDA